MQITAKEQKGLTHHFHVVVPAKDVEAQVEEELQSLGKKVKISGFRPGHVPMPVLKKKYGKDVMGEVLQNAVNKATRDVVEQKKLRPAMQPDVKITDFKEGGDLSFDVSVEVMPEVPATDFSKIKVDEFVVEVPESEVQEGLERLAKSRRHTHTFEGAAKEGHLVKIDFVGKKGGKPFDGGTAKGHSLELGSGQFIPGFEEQLIGAKAGDERQVNVTFPKDYHSKDLAGEKVTFDVTVHEVHHFHTPDIDDKLAEGLGFENLTALKKAVKDQISADLESAGRSRSKKQLFDALDKLAKFEVPQKMLSSEFESIWQQVQQAKKAGDPSLKDKSEAELKKEYEAIAERRVKLGILLADVGRTNNIQITREELSAAVMQQARNYPGQEEKIFEFYRKNPQQIDELKGPILEEKAVDWILTQVTRTKKSVTIDELLKDEDAEASDADAKPKKAAKKK